MARPRSDTATLTRESHNVSLKVLRLSRPSLSEQSPIPKSNIAGIPQIASLAYPSTTLDGDYILTPILSLPPSFGSAYIGETFACTIVANNEVDTITSSSGATTKSITNLKLVAEMQTPSQTVPLELLTSPLSTNDNDSNEETQNAELAELKPKQSVQRIIEFPLREEGSHTLIVGVSYSETITNTHQQADQTQNTSSASPSSGVTQGTTRARTFRKMYQFPTTPCLSVRTKATDLPPLEVPDKALGDPYGRISLLRYVLEAQLENVSESRIMLERAVLLARPPFKAISANHGISSEDFDRSDSEVVDHVAEGQGQGQGEDRVVLQPRSVHQLLFHVVQQANVSTGLEEVKAGLKADGRIVLGQIALEWRSAMGEKGGLSTGNLMTRRRQ